MIECTAMLFSAGGSQGLLRTSDVTGIENIFLSFFIRHYKTDINLPAMCSFSNSVECVCAGVMWFGGIKGHLWKGQSDVKWSKEIKPHFSNQFDVFMLFVIIAHSFLSLIILLLSYGSSWFIPILYFYLDEILYFFFCCCGWVRKIFYAQFSPLLQWINGWIV